MAHPGDGGTMGSIEAGLLRKDRQDPIGEADQPGGAAIAEAPGPLLWSDVIDDRQLRIAPPQPQSEIHIGAHVINQHRPIGWMAFQPAPQPGLQLQGGEHQGQSLQQADRPHAHGVGQQLGAGLAHAIATQGHHLQGQLPLGRLRMQGTDQQGSLQITGHLTGAHQQAHHQRWAGSGPRRPGPTEASRKRQSSSAAGSSGNWRAERRASANTSSLR